MHSADGFSHPSNGDIIAASNLTSLVQTSLSLNDQHAAQV